MVPYLSVAGFTRRSPIPASDVAIVQKTRPGYVESLLRAIQSEVNARLRKRYQESIPFGGSPAQPSAAGTSPPVVTLTGIPTDGSVDIWIQIQTPGPVATAAGQWSQDGGVTWTPFTTAPAVVLGTTGITANFAAGSYSSDNLYVAPAPVPEQILRWMTKIATPEVYLARGVNAQDPVIAQHFEARTESRAELLEAANSNTGLLELPTNEANADSAVVTGGPGGYTETSPYVWTDVQRDDGRGEDCQDAGTGYTS